MTRKTKGRAVLLAFGIVAVFAALTSVWEPAHWAIAVVGSYMRISGPPPILGTVTCRDLPRCTKASADFTAILRERFPAGSGVDALKKTLSLQGFVAPNLDAQMLSYGWGHLPCSKSVSVQWTADGRGAIKTIDGHYSNGCT
jgi:hypothetical protein